MTDNKQEASQRLRSIFLTPDQDASEMVLVHLDHDVVEGLKARFGADWKTAAAELLRQAKP